MIDHKQNRENIIRDLKLNLIGPSPTGKPIKIDEMLIFDSYEDMRLPYRQFNSDFENNEGKYQLEVSLEDQKLIPEIQQNLQAGIYNEGPLSKKYETGVAYFHDLYLTKLNLENKK